jgi:DNA-binding transcriptional regulator YiaG
MGVCKNIDVPLLYQLWNDRTLTRAEIASRLGISHTFLTRLVAKHKLPPRQAEHKRNVVDPTPDEIERLKAELKAKHMAERRAEPYEVTVSKVSKWRAGVCLPGGGRHA